MTEKLREHLQVISSRKKSQLTQKIALQNAIFTDRRHTQSTQGPANLQGSASLHQPIFAKNQATPEEDHYLKYLSKMERDSVGESQTKESRGSLQYSLQAYFNVIQSEIGDHNYLLQQRTRVSSRGRKY